MTSSEYAERAAAVVAKIQELDKAKSAAFKELETVRREWRAALRAEGFKKMTAHYISMGCSEAEAKRFSRQ